MSISQVKREADKKAEQSAAECRALLARNPVTALSAGTVKNPIKFYRRLAGLRNGDLKAAK